MTSIALPAPFETPLGVIRLPRWSLPWTRSKDDVASLLTVTGRGTKIQTGFTTGPVTFSPSGTCAVGSLMIIGLNLDVQFPSGVTDNAGGNTWTVVQSLGGNRKSAVAYCVLATQITAATTISVSLAGAITELYASLTEFANTWAASVNDKNASVTPGFGTGMDGGTTAATTQASELVIGWFGTDTGSLTFTPGTGFSAFGAVSDTGRSAFGEYKSVAATGTQRAQGTASGNCSSDGQTMTFKFGTAASASLVADSRHGYRHRVTRRW